MPDEIKSLFQGLNESDFSDKSLEQALQKAKQQNQFRRLNYGKYKVLLCGDHNGKEINLDFLKDFRKELRLMGINCVIGDDYIQRAKGTSEKDIRESYLNDADIIVFINGQSPGTIEESGVIRKSRVLKGKTLAFFKYSAFEEIKSIPDKGSVEKVLNSGLSTTVRWG